MGLGWLLPGGSEIRIIGAAVFLAGAGFAAWHLKGQIDAGELKESEAACFRDKLTVANALTAKVDAEHAAYVTATEATRTVEALMAKQKQDAEDAYAAQVQSDARALAAGSVLDGQLRRQLAAARAAAGAARGGAGAVPGAAGSAAGGGDTGQIALDIAERFREFGRRCVEEAAADRAALTEAVAAWPTGKPR